MFCDHVCLCFVSMYSFLHLLARLNYIGRGDFVIMTGIWIRRISRASRASLAFLAKTCDCFVYCRAYTSCTNLISLYTYIRVACERNLKGVRSTLHQVSKLGPPSRCSKRFSVETDRILYHVVFDFPISKHQTANLSLFVYRKIEYRALNYSHRTYLVYYSHWS